MKNTQNQRPISGKNVGTVQGRGVNEASKQNSARSSHNSFPLTYTFACTARYGELTPFYVQDAHAKDITPLFNHHQLKSLALKSPLMSRVKMHKDYFEVPFKAILPRTFELIYNNPSQGDDVPSDAYCYVDMSFLIMFSNLVTTKYLYDRFVAGDGNLPLQTVEYYIKSLFLTEAVFSKGSLLNYLGCPLYHLVGDSDNLNFVSDSSDYISKTIEIIFDVISDLDDVYFTIDDYFSYTSRGVKTNKFTCSKSAAGMLNCCYVSINRLVELLHHNSWSLTSGTSLLNNLVGEEGVISLLYNQYNYTIFIPNNFHLDLSRLIAYQLVCSHFYTNDSIDFVYSADKYRKACEAIYLSSVGPFTNSPQYFSYNGEKILYDVFSKKIFDVILSYAGHSVDTWIGNGFNRFYYFFSNIFFYRRSLKFGDYFTGARPYPLAVGDNTVYANLDDGSINPIEVVRSIQGTRFLNAVNRSGPRVQDYLAQIYGTVPAPCDTDPKFISRSTSTLSGFDVNNTADQQGKQTSMFSDTSDGKRSFAFEVNTEGFPSILLGICSFEMQRLFSDAVDRSFFKKDRFDFFNPYFQYEGDQALLSAELGIFAQTDLDDDTFAYTLRDMQYKQRLNRAVGGFVSQLPSWTNVVSNSYELAAEISPEFIRSSVSEFDKFFPSLTGFGLANYFHFIINFVNESETLRAMEYQPAILNG